MASSSSCPPPDQVKFSFPNQDHTKTLLVSSLGPDVCPKYIRDLFLPYGFIKSLRVLWERDDQDTIASIEFEDHRSAEQAMSEIEKNTKKNFENLDGNANAVATTTTKVGGEAETEEIGVDAGQRSADPENVMSMSGVMPKTIVTSEVAKGFNVFIGNTQNLTEEDLMEAFQPYGRILRVFLMRSRGFAYLTFADEFSVRDAIRGMDGATVKKTTIRVDWDRNPGKMVKKTRVEKEKDLELDRETELEKISQQARPENTSIFCCYKPGILTDELLRKKFSRFGKITALKCYKDEGYAFITFQERSSAISAIYELDGVKTQSGGVVTVVWQKQKPRVKQNETRDDEENFYVSVGATGGMDGATVKNTTDCNPERMTKKKTTVEKDEKREEGKNCSVFVGATGDLTEEDLSEAFRPFGRIRKLVLVRDYKTGLSKKFAFVTFANEASARDAIREMNRATVKNTTIGVLWDHGRKVKQEPERQEEYYASSPRNKAQHTKAEEGEEMEFDQDQDRQKEFYYDKISQQSSPENTTIFCCYKKGILTDQLLRKKFSPFGKITGVKCYEQEGYGFIRFEERRSAIEAIIEKNGVKPKKGGVVMVGWGNW